MSRALPYTAAESEAVLDALFRFAGRDEFSSHIDVEIEHFFASAPNSIDDPMEIPECRAAFWLWAMLDMPACAEGEMIVGLFAKKHKNQSSIGERRYLEALRRARMGVYEVVVASDVGVMLRDLNSGDPLFVGVDLRKSGVRRWDIIAARILREQGMLEVLEPFYTFAPFHLPELLDCLKTARRESKKFARESSGASDREVERALVDALLAPTVTTLWLHAIDDDLEAAEEPEQLPLLEEASVEFPSSSRERYQRFLHDPVPMLSGRTLREAAGQRSQRRRVEAILKTIEQAEDDRRAAGEDFVDVSQLWDELGMSP